MISPLIARTSQLLSSAYQNARAPKKPKVVHPFALPDGATLGEVEVDLSPGPATGQSSLLAAIEAASPAVREDVRGIMGISSAALPAPVPTSITGKPLPSRPAATVASGLPASVIESRQKVTDLEARLAAESHPTRRFQLSVEIDEAHEIAEKLEFLTLAEASAMLGESADPKQRYWLARRINQLS